MRCSVSVIMKSAYFDIMDDEAIIVLPTWTEEIDEYLKKYPDAKIYDLQDNENKFDDLFHIISVDCSIYELNYFLNAIDQIDDNEFYHGADNLLRIREKRMGGKVTTKDMMKQANIWFGKESVKEEIDGDTKYFRELARSLKEADITVGKITNNCLPILLNGKEMMAGYELNKEQMEALTDAREQIEEIVLDLLNRQKQEQDIDFDIGQKMF